MSKNTEKEIKFPINPLDVLVFERILSDLGISKTEYCTLRGKASKSWFYNVLRKRGYLNHADIKALFGQNSGVLLSEWDDLCEKYDIKCEKIEEN
jgi:hypothetical protein